MSRLRLYNYFSYDVPEPIPELLELLGFWTAWDISHKVHRIYEHIGKRRMKWPSQEFKGGTVEEWQAFLSRITSEEHLL